MSAIVRGLAVGGGVGEVEAEDVGAGGDQLLERGRVPAGGTDRGDDLGAAPEVDAVLARPVRLHRLTVEAAKITGRRGASAPRNVRRMTWICVAIDRVMLADVSRVWLGRGGAGVARRADRGSRAGPARRPSGDPAAAPRPVAALQPAPDRVRLPRPPRARRSLQHARRRSRGRGHVTSHPDHVRSLFTANPEQAPSLTGESPLRPILGPNSVLTAVGPRHMRQRKLLLAALPRRGDRGLHADDLRRGRTRDRPLAARRALRAGAADAGDHARRDHGRDLRHRGQARGAAPPSTACGR